MFVVAVAVEDGARASAVDDDDARADGDAGGD